MMTGAANNNNASITILYSTQSGRAKACARRSSRLLRSKYPSIVIRGNCSFDEFGVQNFLSLGSTQHGHLLLLFVSTTGDGEHTTSIARTWSALLSKSLSPTLFANVHFALFALGDRAYGDAFCAAGRKLAARMVQLGASPKCVLGYGDDGSGAGVLGDLDVWLGESFFGVVDCLQERDNEETVQAANTEGHSEVPNDLLLYNVEMARNEALSHSSDEHIQEWQKSEYSQSYADYFQHSCPDTAYQYNEKCVRIAVDSNDFTHEQSIDTSSNLLTPRAPPLLGCVTVNDRITSEDWMQNTRHLRIHVTKQMKSCSNEVEGNRECTLPYQAGDVATVLPQNPQELVSKFLSLLPDSIRAIADTTIRIQRINHQLSSTSHPWPELCTLRGLFTYCADIQSLPEQEDLFALSAYCNINHVSGKDQRDKMISLSETSGADLYADYIIRNKRNWVDLFYDFDSLFYEHDFKETIGVDNNIFFAVSSLLSILPSIAPRHFSIASAPSYIKQSSTLGFELELCVAVVEGTTSLGRTYSGCCSSYLASIKPCDEKKLTQAEMVARDNVRLWITPGSFHKLPLGRSRSTLKAPDTFFETPILCVGAGTGIAPLRSLIYEREAIRLSHVEQIAPMSENNVDRSLLCALDNTLVFGCRKKLMDFYYGTEWETLAQNSQLRLIPAFSRDQKEKLYVQRALKEMDHGSFIARHILERQGAVYIAGASKMARAVKDEIVTALGSELDGGESDAKKLLNRLKRKGLFSIEAWS